MSKLVQLEVSNVQRIKYVMLKFDKDQNLVVVGGKNAAGKTSLLDAIRMCYGGKSAVPPQPLKHGASKGYIRCTEDNGCMTERRFTQNGTSLKVTDPDGYEVKGQQAVCDAKCGKIHFDPLEFSRMKKAERDATLKQLVGLDFRALDQARSQAFTERTMVNREVKNLEERLKAAPSYPDAPESEVSISALSEQLDAMRDRNRKHESTEQGLEQARNRVMELEEALDRAKDSVAEFEAALAANPEAQDTEPVVEQLRNAEHANAQVRANAEHAELAESLAGKQAEANALTARLTEIDAEKQTMLQNARFQVPGLGFDDNGVTYQGVPLEQASSAELLRISAAVGFALAPNPDQLQVMLIRDGSLLDADSLRMLAKEAYERGVMLFLEVVGDQGDVVIEDGTVKESQ